MHNHSIDEAIAALAGRQYGVVSRDQLRRLGLGDTPVQRRLAAGRLHRIHRGVYAVGHRSLTQRSFELAAVLACGPGAVLSHRSAAKHWGLVNGAPKIEVTCKRTRPPSPSIVVHRSPLPSEHRVVRDDIPVTTVARTIVDLADVLTQPRLADAVNEAEVQRVFDLREVEQALERMPGRRGRAKLDRILADYTPTPFTRSEAERRFLKMCARNGLPRPRVNMNIAGYEVDFLWPEQALAVEVDGASAHLTQQAFQRDRRRDRDLAAKGIRVVRVTWRDLEEGRALAHQMKAILAA
ncbi:MAG TPA: type IV toxin-antitoxin system AbiEi family antitoxin domain-containing protein [Thermoleophilaceae bacterium]|nr:type IV toxin-antitoxin system AbiEi family antitoxin domain-containing protein [Thermoleophilaceae bacterium]